MLFFLPKQLTMKVLEKGLMDWINNVPNDEGKVIFANSANITNAK